MSASLKLHCTVLKCLRQANPREDHRRQRTFAWAVVAVILTGSASLGQWISAVVSQAQAASTWRRLWRLMNNTHVDVASYYEPYIRAAVKGWGGRHALVAIDTTSMQDRRIVFRAALIYRGRAVPLVWKAVSTCSHSLPFEVYEPLLEQARALLPATCTVTLLGDRGFGGVRLMAWCRRRGWHFALRLKGNRAVVLDDGHRNRLAAFAVGPRDLRLLERVHLVGAKRHGLGAVNIAITRSPQEGSEPWFIVSDRSDALGILADYRCRMNIEHAFKDDKSGALGWEGCRMDTGVAKIRPGHPDRGGRLSTTRLDQSGPWSLPPLAFRTDFGHTRWTRSSRSTDTCSSWPWRCSTSFRKAPSSSTLATSLPLTPTTSEV